MPPDLPLAACRGLVSWICLRARTCAWVVVHCGWSWVGRTWVGIRREGAATCVSIHRWPEKERMGPTKWCTGREIDVTENRENMYGLLCRLFWYSGIKGQGQMNPISIRYMAHHTRIKTDISSRHRSTPSTPTLRSESSVGD